MIINNTFYDCSRCEMMWTKKKILSCKQELPILKVVTFDTFGRWFFADIPF